MDVGIVGLGLIGGSIGLALRKPGTRILGWDPDPQACAVAENRQCVDAVTPPESVAKCDIVFVASPPRTVVENLGLLSEHRGPETVLTDCASVKAEAVRWARESGEARFVPGHPMAGHEKGGAAYASPWLFRNARWILCPLSKTDRGAIRPVEAAVKAMGGLPVRMDPATHDRQIAILSHLPHVLAGILVRQGSHLESADVAAGSWRDLTRVGGVDPELWTQILMGNREELARVLGDAVEDLSSLRSALETGSEHAIKTFFLEAAAAKQKHEPPPRPAARPIARKRR